VETITPSPVRALGISSRDPLFTDQWALGVMQGDELHAAGYRGTGRTVAIVDTGIATLSEDQPAHILAPWSVPGYASSGGIDGHGHGTLIASMIAAPVDGAGVQGLAPGVTLMPIKALGDNAIGTNLDVAIGIRHAVDAGADVINLSFGSTHDNGGLLADALAYASTLGVTTVCATGNDRGDLLFPARLDDCIAVGALNASDSKASFSNKGPGIDLAAPGFAILARNHLGATTTVDGTSFAAPYAAASAAILLASGAANPTSLRTLMTSTAFDVEVPGWDERTGYGRVNPFNAVIQGLALTDACSNIVAFQFAVPENHDTDAGSCIEIDHCTNIEGAQHNVPAHHEASAGSCIEIDRCTNLDGPQHEVPMSLERSPDGICSTPPPPITTTTTATTTTATTTTTESTTNDPTSTQPTQCRAPMILHGAVCIPTPSLRQVALTPAATTLQAIRKGRFPRLTMTTAHTIRVTVTLQRKSGKSWKRIEAKTLSCTANKSCAASFSRTTWKRLTPASYKLIVSYVAAGKSTSRAVMLSVRR
jgi:hypothetical protein